MQVGTEVAPGKSATQDLLRSMYNFCLGGVAGGIGATAGECWCRHTVLIVRRVR